MPTSLMCYSESYLPFKVDLNEHSYFLCPRFELFFFKKIKKSVLKKCVCIEIRMQLEKYYVLSITEASKGQLISKCLLVVIVLTKKQQILQEFCPSL